MPQVHLSSASEQVADHLRQEILSGLRVDVLPGVNRLAGELGVNHKTVESALRLLEKEGIVTSQGPRRSRRVNLPGDKVSRPGLRVALMLMNHRDRGDDYLIELRHLLEEAGHFPFFTEKSLVDLDMNAKRVARFVKRTKADAWVIAAGSREVMQWFAEQPFATFALFGRRENLPIAGAGPDKSPATEDATRQLIDLGHRRITFLVRRLHRLPHPSPSVRAYLDVLAENDVQVGDFNLPDWEESREGFQEILDSLFQLTPPTAIITDEAYLFVATQQFMANRGIRIPHDVSLISTDSDPTFAWCKPSVAHISWDYRPTLRRIVRWAANVSQGKTDLRQTLTKAEFIRGGTVDLPPA